MTTGAAAPRVSVLIPVLDGELFIGATLAAVREQTLTDHEVVVVDAGCSDGSERIVRAAAAHDPRVRWVPSSGRRLTAPMARNAGLREARGALIATVDHDDLLAPGYLARQAEVLDGTPDVGMVAAFVREIDEAGLPTGGSSSPAPLTPALMSWGLAFASPAPSSGLVFRAEALAAVGGFDERFPLSDDYAALIAVDRAAGLAYLHDPFVGYRRYPQQSSERGRWRQRAEVILLRADLVAHRLGRRPPLAVVRDLDTSRRGAVTRPAEAISLVGELRDAFLASRHLTGREARIIKGWAQARIEAIGAAEVVAADDPGAGRSAAP